ncbi:MAG: NTP transferase domain-containing protein [Methanomassiliicoccus sp.]|nr:NTP transferase domain-containing protein [Methanomassiliicoccus sp.]
MKDVPGEKPLVKVLGRPMIDRVMEAFEGASEVNDIFVSVSPHAPETARYLKKMKAKLIDTPGTGYCEDLNLSMSHIPSPKVLVCPVDLPLLTSEGIDAAVSSSSRSQAGSFCVTVPVELMNSLGMDLTYSLEVSGRRVVLCGVSVVDRLLMLTGRELEQEYMITEAEEFALNVNTRADLERAEAALRRRSTSR